MGSATTLGYATWLICTNASILLAELLLVLLQRSSYIARLYNYFRLVRHTSRDCDILGPLVALFIAPLFSHKLFDINVSPSMTAPIMCYFRLHYYGNGRPRDFRVRNVLFMLTVNVAYGEFGFGPNTCALVAFFTYFAIMLGDQAGAAHDDDDDDNLRHLTLNQIMSNLIIACIEHFSFEPRVYRKQRSLPHKGRGKVCVHPTLSPHLWDYIGHLVNYFMEWRRPTNTNNVAQNGSGNFTTILNAILEARQVTTMKLYNIEWNQELMNGAAFTIIQLYLFSGSLFSVVIALKFP